MRAREINATPIGAYYVYMCVKQEVPRLPSLYVGAVFLGTCCTVGTCMQGSTGEPNPLTQAHLLQEGSAWVSPH